MTDPAPLPLHLGIIMDGNGRWAQSRGLGLDAAKRITKAASDAGIRYLSLYVFSTENWKRAEQEVSFLMFLLKKHLLKEWDFYRDNEIRVVHSGNLAGLPLEIQGDLVQIQKDTAGFPGLTVNLAINYGGQDEILRAMGKWHADVNRPALDAASFVRYLDQPELPPLDLLVRTAGEVRLSNFLLWQSAYAEFYFSPKFWPDWQWEDLSAALKEYQKRQRKFGGVHE